MPRRAYTIQRELQLHLCQQRILGLSEDADKQLLVQRMERNQDRKTTNQLWHNSELDQIPLVCLREQFVPFLVYQLKLIGSDRRIKLTCWFDISSFVIE